MLLASQGLIDLEGEKLIVKHINPIDEIARVCTCPLIQRFCPCMDKGHGSMAASRSKSQQLFLVQIELELVGTSSATLQISSVSSLIQNGR